MNQKKPIFVVTHILRSEEIRLIKGFFYALLIILCGFVTPFGCLMAPTLLRGESTGSAEPLFYSAKHKSIVSTIMTNSKNNCDPGLPRNPESTLDARNALKLAYSHFYPLVHFSFTDDGKLFRAIARFDCSRYQLESDELPLLIVKLNNILTESVKYGGSYREYSSRVIHNLADVALNLSRHVTEEDDD